jgi:hypothetical protein
MSTNNVSPDDAKQCDTTPVYMCVLWGAAGAHCVDTIHRPPQFVLESKTNKFALSKMCSVGLGIKCPDSFLPFIEVISNLQLHYRGPVGTSMARVLIEDHCQVVGRALEVQKIKQLDLIYIKRNLYLSTKEVLNRSILYEWASLFVGRKDIKFTFVQEKRHTTVYIYSILYLHGRGEDAE